MARRRKTTAALVRRIPSAPPTVRVQEIVRVAPAPRRSVIARAGGYLRRSAGSLTSSSRLRRAGAVAVGGAVAPVVQSAFAQLVGTGQPGALITPNLLTGIAGYVLADGSGSFTDGIGLGMLASAGGQVVTGILNNLTANRQQQQIPQGSNFVGPPSPFSAGSP